MAALLGDDGRGYELARKLESLGVWRSWLGDSLYPPFARFLSTPTTWEAFMRTDDSKTKAQIQLQLRVRALLFDKASIALYLRSDQSSSSSSSLVSKLNPNYLQLHGDDLYFTLENSSQDVAATNAMSSKVQPKSNFGVGSRYSEKETDFASQQFKGEDLPTSWYDQFFEKFKASKSYKKSFGDREAEKRTPEMMAVYLRVLENHKRKRAAFRGDQSFGFGMLDDGPTKQSSLVLDGSSVLDQETSFFPEIMFSLNCVPDSAILKLSQGEETQRVEFKGVLDTLPQIMTKSPIMIERLGIRPEYMEQGGNQSRGKNGFEGSRKVLGAEQASKLSEKVVAQLLTNVGFEASLEVPLEVLAQLLSCHIGKLGRILKLLSDSYRKQCSAIELLKMFLQTAGHSNLGALAELVKDNSRNITHQTPQQQQGFQAQLQQPQHQAPIRQPQQILRQMHPQMPQMINPQNVSIQQQQQQQWERMRRRQQSTPRPGGMGANMNVNNMNIEKDRPLVEVKLENPSEFPIDNTSNAINAMNARNSQLLQMQQLRQQQFAAMQASHSQSGNQFRPMANPQIPQVHSPNMGMVRAPPVKVEGFQELMGGDPSMKHDSEENKLTSPK
nr:Transcription initiation factor TFIID subunit 8, putative isoform 1 [Ipomoea batatas]